MWEARRENCAKKIELKSVKRDEDETDNWQIQSSEISARISQEIE